MKQKTKERIMEVAAEVFGEKGYHSTAVEEISRRTQMSKGGVYFHFPTKQGLFFAVIDHLANRLIKHIENEISFEPDPLKRIDLALSKVLEILGKRRSLAKLLLVQGYSMGTAFEKKRMDIYSRFSDLISRNLDAAIDDGIIEPLNTKIASQLWLGGINEILIQWLYSDIDVNPKDTLPVLRRVLIRGLVD